jgi:nucleoid-associated protein YgaU
MRALILLLVLAGSFALAAVWQRRHVAELRAARQEAESEPASPAAGAPTLAPGEALLVVGRPSGAEPRPRPADPVVPQKSGGEGGASALSDFTQLVQDGQTLSGIAHVHYGQSGPALVRALATYNELSDPDQLKVGQSLRLPPIERLQAGAR